MVAQCPRTVRQDIRQDVSPHIRTIARQLCGDGKCNAAKFPRGNLQDNSQHDAERSGNVHVAASATDNATSREISHKTARRNLIAAFSTMTLQNYEYINRITTNAQS
jgi:hypothetical protein